MWRLTVVLLALALGFGSVGCAPKLLGPTSSGYFISLQATPRAIWQEPPNPPLHTPYSTSSVLIVRVRDAQGQPIDDVPVQFEVEPAWSQDATVSPQQTTTQDGKAQASFQAFNTGVVRVRAHVDAMTQEVSITARPPYSIREPNGG